ncbi:MAG TPA: type II toxin-antitoxin system VapC family toxin [Egibacteraceae bacterium]|nr:type II toxin-antitoxin system VapC family toxin [Actinomycetota bacterium]HWB72036.1 type II toxin-antitoxin system VapC family toxin [Egibacteraceae bacterium]
MSFLIDTNVVSELRKGDRADGGVRRWIAAVPDEELFLSVLVIGELRKGVELFRRRDDQGAGVLDHWLRQVSTEYGDRILPVTVDVAEVWGRLNVPDPLPVVDSLLAATARVHGLTMVTRNTAHIGRTGVPVVNPFESSPPAEHPDQPAGEGR